MKIKNTENILDFLDTVNNGKPIIKGQTTLITIKYDCGCSIENYADNDFVRPCLSHIKIIEEMANNLNDFSNKIINALGGEEFIKLSNAHDINCADGILFMKLANNSKIGSFLEIKAAKEKDCFEINFFNKDKLGKKDVMLWIRSIHLHDLSKVYAMASNHGKIKVK